MANTLEELNGRRHFDYIVIGCGGVGSGALYWLAKRAGENVLGLEKFKLGHVNGGSQDASRSIRVMHGDPQQVKLAIQAFEAWEEVERESGYPLFHKSGYLHIAKRGKDEAVVKRFAKLLVDHGVKVDYLNHEQLLQRYPQFQVGPDTYALFEKDAGILDAAAANSIHVQLAQGRGAKVIDQCPVIRLARSTSGLVEVSTPKGTFTCKKVVVTAGAWINHVISSIGCHVPVTVTQENVTYFGSPHIKEFRRGRFPVFYCPGDEYDIYALPVHGITGTKIGVDVGTQVTTADTRTFEPDPVRLKAVTDFCKAIVPKFLGPVIETKVCLYTMPPDRHFLIDTAKHAGFDDVIVFCGAGHAFKFASLMGKILSEMAIDGNTQYDISLFKWDREALKDPTLKPEFRHTRHSKTPSKL